MGVYLSVCMIVKDEEKVLKRCLESIHEIADEIIIVDTGSVDKTKEIALNFTDKIYYFKWKNDFAAARNYSASKAKGEWIFVIDADEYVDPESFMQLKENLQLHYNEYNILIPNIVNFIGHKASQTVLNRHERIYKNNGKVKYDRPIHEVLVSSEGKSISTDIDFDIYHSGYSQETVKSKNKKERNLSILQAKKNKSAVDYFYLGNEYSSLNHFTKAITYYKKAFNMQKNVTMAWESKLLHNMIIVLRKDKKLEDALSVTEAGIMKYPTQVDFLYYKGLIHYESENYTKAKELFEKILNNNERYVAEHSYDYMELFPTIHLAKIYEKDNIQKSVEYYSKAISITNLNQELWSRLLYLLGSNATLEELSAFINDKLVTSNDMTEGKLINILLNVPLKDVQKLSRSLLDNEALTQIENDALFIKNHYLDYQFEEVLLVLEEWTDDKIVSTMLTGIFSLRDFIMFTLLAEYERGERILYEINFSESIRDLLNLLLKDRRQNISENEQDIFISVYKQSKVLGIENLTELLESKVFALNRENRTKLNEIKKGKY